MLSQPTASNQRAQVVLFETSQIALIVQLGRPDARNNPVSVSVSRADGGHTGPWRPLPSTLGRSSDQRVTLFTISHCRPAAVARMSSRKDHD